MRGSAGELQGGQRGGGKQQEPKVFHAEQNPWKNA
jgi:hypothetical protein